MMPETLYYCRVYGVSNFPNLQGTLLSIDDSRSDPRNPSCLSDRTDNQTGWRFDNSSLAPQSSIRLLGGSLRPNRTYQMMIYMENRRNSSIQASGFVLVRVEETRPQLIVIGCVISTMCNPNLEFQLVNPTTQVALFALCIGNCENLLDIRWNIYQGLFNPNLNLTQWILFNQTTNFENIDIFGRSSSNFTSTNRLFIENPSVESWRFEVTYRFVSATSSSALNFVINRSPYNGSCSIHPLNGTTSTVFTVSCPDWFDDDEIKDYSIRAWTDDESVEQRLMIGYSPLSTLSIRLPSNRRGLQTSTVNLRVLIRDLLDCVTEVNISSVLVSPDTVAIDRLINGIQSSSTGLTSNPLVQLLSSGNQNLVSQVITSVSQQINTMSTDTIDQATQNGIPFTSIAVSSLTSSSISSEAMTSLNESALRQYEEELNRQANAREFLLTYLGSLRITTSNSIKLQSSTLAQLTQSTNQLARQALSIVAKKISQLAVALDSRKTRLSFEDVQLASMSLVQCATNILTAVNGPLQGRMMVLQSDRSGANQVSSEYDTDLESSWSNPNLFAEGDDFSRETIDRNRNLFYQRTLANDISTTMTESISLLTSALQIHLNVGQNFVVNTSQVMMSLETISVDSLRNSKSIDKSLIQLPSNLRSDSINNHSIVSLRLMFEPLSPFGSSKVSSNTNTSRSVSLSILDSNSRQIAMNTDGNQTIEFRIPRDPSLFISSMTRENVTSIVINQTSLLLPHQLLFYLHYVNLTTSSSSSLPVSLHLRMRPLNASLAYLFIYKFDQSPQLNSSIQLIDGWTLLCPSQQNATNESVIFEYFFDNDQTSDHRSLIFGLRELNDTELHRYCHNHSSNTALVRPPTISDEGFHFTADYELRLFTSGCYYLDDSQQWKADGLLVGSLTNERETQCFSKHLTTFAGGFVVLPKPINWSYVFANADFLKSKTMYLTIIGVSLLFLILLIFARVHDKKDLLKLGVTPLPDNHSSDRYFYQILVFTGRRSNAGTESKVHLILSGDDDQTSVRIVFDPQRKILQRGSIDAFVMSVPKSLGLLNFIRLWHDNTGQGQSASWFLKYIIVQDLQTMQKFHFIAQQWFAVEEGDGLIERVLPVAGPLEKHQFSYVLSKKAYHSISDGHLWFSIFSRPPSNRFTRVQRCTSCFVLLFISMLLNIMYYDLAQQAKNEKTTESGGIFIGPLHITPQQIGIGVMCEMISLIPSLLIVQLFRRIRPRKKHLLPSLLRQAMFGQNASQINSPSTSVPVTKTKKGPITLPWWCLFIAYGLSLIFILISIFFIIVRGIEFGDLKTQQWITSIVTAFFSSILLTQPIKILCLAIFVALFCRNVNDDVEAQQFLNDDSTTLDHDEEYLHSLDNDIRLVSRSSTASSSSGRIPLNKNKIAFARDQRVKEIEMWSLIREFVTYLMFLSLICTIVYSSREQNSFLQVQHLRRYFLNQRQIDLDFTKIGTVDQYWTWLEQSFVSNLRAQSWYNGDVPRYLGGFIDDKSNRLIGWATMRQLRVKPSVCDDQRLFSMCLSDYSRLNEDTTVSYQPGWTNETTADSYSRSIQRAFQYRTSDELDSYLYLGNHANYRGGGYVYEFRGSSVDLRSNLSMLRHLEWINNQTRAILIDLTLYNPNAQLFTSVTLIVEILATGGFYPSARFEPVQFYGFTSLLQLICTIVYVLFIVHLLINEIRSFQRLQRRYFLQFWSLIEMGVIVCSCVSIGVYVWRYKEFDRLSSLFEQTSGYVYINLQLAVYVNDIFTFFFGFCCFFATIRCIRLFRSNARISLFIHTLRFATRELLSFTFMFSIVFFSFMALFYLLFVSKIASCATLLGTAQMLFEISLMKFDTSELIGASAVLGPLAFALFIFLVVFICLSMFLSIINVSFRRARENITPDQGMFTLIFNRFLLSTGLRKATVEERHEERDTRIRSQYLDPMELLPVRIDQLFVILNKIYINQKRELLIMDSVDEGGNHPLSNKDRRETLHAPTAD